MASSNETRTIDPVLQSGFVESFMNAQESYMAPMGKVFPIINTDEKTGTYYKWDHATNFSRANAFPAGGDLARGYGAPYVEAPKRAITSATYSTVDYGEFDLIDRYQEEDAAKSIALRGGLTQALLSDVLIAAERRLQGPLSDNSVMTQYTTLATTTCWSDYDNSTPVANITTAVDTVRLYMGGGLGVTHDLVAITNPTAWNTTRFHPDLATAISGNRNQVFTKEDFLAFFGISELLIPDCVDNSSNVGQTGSNGYIWEDDFIVFARPKNPSTATAALGYCFEQRNLAVESERKTNRLDEITVSHTVDEKFVNAGCGYLIENIIA